MGIFDRFKTQPTPSRQEADRRLEAAQQRLEDQKALRQLQKVEKEVADFDREQAKSPARRYGEGLVKNLGKGVFAGIEQVRREGQGKGKRRIGGSAKATGRTLGGPFTSQPLGNSPFAPQNQRRLR